MCITPTVLQGHKHSINTQKNPRAHKNKIGTSTPPSQKAQNPPLKGGILWARGFSSRKNQRIPGAHKTGAAISGPRITGGKLTDTRIFLNYLGKSRGSRRTPQSPAKPSKVPPQRLLRTPRRGKFPRRASRQVAPLRPSGTWVHRGRSDTVANANANSHAPWKFASEF